MPGDIDDGTYGPTPPTDADEPVESSSENDASTNTDSDIVAANPEPEASDTAPTAEDEMSDVVSTEDDETTRAVPVSAEPDENASDAAQAEGAQDTRAAASASKGVQDFLTPLLGELDAIRQRPDMDASETETASRRRAAANVQDQLIRRMLDEIAVKDDSRSSTQLVKSDDAKQTQPLAARWYAEA